jgi:thiaminase
MSDIASREDIKRYLEKGKKNGAKYMLMVCDTFSFEDYPVYVKENEKLVDIINKYDDKNMQEIQEIYNLEMDIDIKLNKDRVWNT